MRNRSALGPAGFWGTFAAVSLLAASCMVTATGPGPAYPASGLEYNVDRPGSDYRSFDLDAPSPEQCQAACMNEPGCVAFTYVNPGVQGPSPRCLLKNAAPPPVPQSCCVSGVKYASAPPPAPEPAPPPPTSGWQGQPVAPPPPPPPEPAPAPPASGWQGQPVAPPPPPQPAPPPASGWQGQPVAPAAQQWEPRTDRPGANYRGFELRTPQPELCRDACWNDRACRAFTYIRPGVQGPTARCWLKNAVPPARLNDCCLSGVK